VRAVSFLLLASASVTFPAAGPSGGAVWVPVIALGVLIVAVPTGTVPLIVLAAALIVICVAGAFLGVTGDPLWDRLATSAGLFVGLALGVATLLAASTLSPEDGGAFVVLTWVLPAADLTVTGAGDHTGDRLACSGSDDGAPGGCCSERRGCWYPSGYWPLGGCSPQPWPCWPA
jgi:hypothetical protein